METDGAMSSTSKGVAESDRVTAERDIKFIDVALAVVLPVCLVRDPHAALEAENSKPMPLFKIGFIATIHVVPSIRNRNASNNAKISCQQ
jgi:hypothetical protein